MYNRDMKKNKKEKYPQIRSIKKTISWRIIATLITGIIVFLFTKELSETTYITLVSAFVLMVFYYIHERIWSSEFARTVLARPSAFVLMVFYYIHERIWSSIR